MSFNPRTEGGNAFRAGIPRRAQPYIGLAARAWLLGWDDAERSSRVLNYAAFGWRTL